MSLIYLENGGQENHIDEPNSLLPEWVGTSATVSAQTYIPQREAKSGTRIGEDMYGNAATYSRETLHTDRAPRPRDRLWNNPEDYYGRFRSTDHRLSLGPSVNFEDSPRRLIGAQQLYQPIQRTSLYPNNDGQSKNLSSLFPSVELSPSAKNKATFLDVLPWIV